MSVESADILIVDDEPEICEMLCGALTTPSRTCTAVTSGRKAFDLLSRRRFDALISDIAMPEMGGLELLAKSRCIRPDCPVILITGVSTIEWAKEAIRRGAFDYLEKPFDLGKMRHTVDAAITQAQQAISVLQTGAIEHDTPISYADPVTHLASHRRFIEELGRLRANCRRTNRPVTVMLIDIDAFRTVNEEYGHAVGDRVLSEIGRRLKSAARESDVVARYGWDQFVMALPDTPAVDGILVADRCIEAVRAKPIEVGGQAVGATVSIGLAECESGFIETEANLLRRAAEALAGAKTAGGNLVMHWDEVAAEPRDGIPPDRSSLHRMRDAFQRVQHQLKQAYVESTRALVAAVEAKDPYTEKHSMTVAHYALSFAKMFGLPAAQINTIGTAAILHDVGKIGIPDSILTKPGALTDAEFDLIKQHPIMGVQILEHVSFLRAELPLIMHHHERWDGRGYPAGLAGEAIPLGARILHLSDAIDAMLSTRSYKDGFSLERTCQELQDGAGKQFDPDMVPIAIQWLQQCPEQIVYPQDRDRILKPFASSWLGQIVDPEAT